VRDLIHHGAAFANWQHAIAFPGADVKRIGDWHRRSQPTRDRNRHVVVRVRARPCGLKTGLQGSVSPRIRVGDALDFSDRACDVAGGDGSIATSDRFAGRHLHPTLYTRPCACANCGVGGRATSSCFVVEDHFSIDGHPRRFVVEAAFDEQRRRGCG